MKKYIISESVYQRLKLLFEQDEESQYIEMSPEQYVDLLNYVSGNGDLISKVKKYKDKKIIINGRLGLSGIEVTSLGPVIKVSGTLDLSNTKISKLPKGIKVDGHIFDYGTPIEARRKAAERRKRREDADERKSSGEWDLETGDEMSEMVHALLQHLDYIGELEERTKEDDTKLQELNSKLDELKRLGDESDGGEDYDEILESIEQVEEEISEIEEKKDVYDFYYDGYHYDMLTFKLIDDDRKTWAVGTESQVESSAYDYVESMIDDIGYKGFSEWVWMNNIDNDKIYYEVYDDYIEVITQEPDDYGVEKTLSKEQEKRIEELEEEISQLEGQQEVLDDELEDYQDLYDDYEEKIEELRDEISEIEDYPDDYDEEQIERMARDYAQDMSDNPEQFFDTYGANIDSYIDKDGFIEDVIRADDYGTLLNSYDGTYDTESINDTDYYIMMIDA